MGYESDVELGFLIVLGNISHGYAVDIFFLLVVEG